MASGQADQTRCDSNSTCGTYSVATPCREGSYNPFEHMDRIDACLPCGETQGADNSSLIGNDTTYRGYYCPDLNSTKQTKCPAGHFCLPALAHPVPCPHGTYRQDQGGFELASCDICPTTMYCPNASLIPLPCPAKFYCPRGSGWPRTCPGVSLLTHASYRALSSVATDFVLVQFPLLTSLVPFASGFFLPCQYFSAIHLPARILL